MCQGKVMMFHCLLLPIPSALKNIGTKMFNPFFPADESVVVLV